MTTQADARRADYRLTRIQGQLDVSATIAPGGESMESIIIMSSSLVVAPVHLSKVGAREG
jgi:hypothetical protein